MMEKHKPYTPPKALLETYAHVLVHYAIGGGTGITKGDVVSVHGNDACKPLYAEVLKAVWKAGGHVIEQYRPSDEPWFKVTRTFFEYSSAEQRAFFPKQFYKGLVEQIDHSIVILAETNPHGLQGINPKKILERQQALKPYRDWRNKKENLGRYTWTVALYGTPQMAKEAGLTERAYWNQIKKACFLDEKRPITKWKQVARQMSSYIQKLNALPIEKLHVTGNDMDLWITLGEKRKWVGGDGRNIPSFEIFTSPDWRGTEGWIHFNQPLYVYGTLITDVELHFKNGKVVKSSASTNESLLKRMIATENADKIGEFSLTDSRFSRITKFMAETLYDENVGGTYGNTHIALGTSYQDTYDGAPEKVTKTEWEKMGFNDSAVHTDIISTTDRTVTAQLRDGSQKTIFIRGRFTL
jgi:aminopeptidase